jgi:hypothetical protein
MTLIDEMNNRDVAWLRVRNERAIFEEAADLQKSEWLAGRRVPKIETVAEDITPRIQMMIDNRQA